LVADDNKVNRLLLGRTLELQGHQVSSAGNGRRALEMLRADAFDLLLLDLEMPELDGFALLELLAADATLRDLPVIVTSSLEGEAHVARSIELAADDYLHKPVNPVLLKARVGSSLEKKRLRDQQKALVERFATSAVALDMATSGFALGGKRVRATVMFTGIRGFTTLVEQQGPEETIELLNTWYTLMRHGEPGRAAARAHQGGGAHGADGRRHAGGARRTRGHRAAGRGGAEGQAADGGGVRAASVETRYGPV
jgi:DNA-binding response OmpR family regulator